MSDLRSKILAAQDTSKEAVSVPEWGIDDGLVFIKTLSAKDRDNWETSMVSVDMERKKVRKVNMANMRARLVVLTLVDAEGKRIFGDDDANQLGEKSAAVIARLFDVAQRVNGLSQEEVKALEKNSVSSQADASASN